MRLRGGCFAFELTREARSAHVRSAELGTIDRIDYQVGLLRQRQI